MRNHHTQPTGSHQYPELLVSFTGLSLVITPLNSLPFLYKMIFSFVLQTCPWFTIVCKPKIAILSFPNKFIFAGKITGYFIFKVDSGKGAHWRWDSLQAWPPWVTARPFSSVSERLEFVSANQDTAKISQA